jgi:microcystin-dependent protein
MASIIKVDQLSEKTQGSGITLSHSLKNSSGSEIISSSGLIESPTFVGMIASFAMSSAPTGWLVCNGAAYANADYSDLYTAIGSQWVTAWTNSESITTGDYRKNSSGVIYIATSTGTTSGTDVGDDVGVTWSASSNFLVPDLRGEFLRGVDSGRGLDSNRVFASTVSDNVKQFQGWVEAPAYADYSSCFKAADGTIFTLSTQVTYGPTYDSSTTQGPRYTRATMTIGSGSETYPKNVAILYCIKY